MALFAGHHEGFALESGEWLMSTFRCAANGAVHSWISQIQIPGKPGRPTSSGPAWTAVATFGRHIPPPEDGLCDPPAQWTEGTLPSRRHLGRHGSGCPRSLSGMARETPGWIAMWRAKFCHKPFTEDPDRLVRFEGEDKVLSSLNHTSRKNATI